MAQAHETRDRLVAAHGLAASDLEIVVITTTGDRIRDRPLAEIGGKGLFTKEIEEALYAREIDFAVHSMKDMPAVVPQGLAFVATLPREDARDALISLMAKSLADLPKGAKLGSSSVRRTAQALRIRPDLEAVQFRGNVETRLKKLARWNRQCHVPRDGRLEPPRSLPTHRSHHSHGADAARHRAGGHRH